jgi:hypothetical protein
MRRSLIIAALIVATLAAAVGAQETYFGKNKVRYKDFEWSYIQTKHFDIYFYADGYKNATFAADALEEAYDVISKQLNYVLQVPIPVFIYNSPNDFQQTNITGGVIPEAVGGFTEAFKKRMVIPFSGSYEEFRHVLHHELTHAVVYDMIYGNMFASLLSRQRLFNLPLWFAEGYAEYSSRYGWDYFSDMYVRDATINGYLAPPEYAGGFLAYKEGQSLIKYIVDTYGEQKIGEILKKGKVYLTMGKALKEAIGKDEEQFYKDYSKEMKRRYWPEIAERKEPDEIGKQLTHARKDGSYLNEKPAFSPEGDKLAIFTDKSDYTEIVLISANSGKVIKRLVKGERSGDLESLHSFVSGVSFSPDGHRIVFVAKSDGKPTLMFYDIYKDKIYKKKRFGFYVIVNPVWSPDGKKIAFSAVDGDREDLFVYSIDDDSITQLTDDRFDDAESSWMPDSKTLVFSSDRPNKYYPLGKQDKHLYLPIDADSTLYGFPFGFYSLFKVDVDSKQVTPLNVGPGQNKTPEVSPDGKKLAFISNRNGIDNIYVAFLDSSKYYAITDILTGIKSFSWSPEGNKIAFEAFNNGGFDVFVMKDIGPVGDNGVLAKTAFVKGEYDNPNSSPKVDTTKQIASAPKAADTVAVADTTLDHDYHTYSIKDTSQFVAATDSLPNVPTAKSDSSASDTTTTAQAQAKKDSVITRTGVYGKDFVFVSDQSQGPFDSLLVDVPDDSTPYPGGKLMKEPEVFDSRSTPKPGQKYDIHKYKVKFTPDYLAGTFGYNTYFGLSGQSFFVFSDYLGNDQIYVATDLVNSIDQSNVQAFYFYNKHRTNYGIGAFHTKNYYLDNNDHLFSDRFYGFQTYLSRPFSTFRRIDLYVSQYFIDRQYYDYNDPRPNKNSKVTTAELSYVLDNVIWGYTGPINGRRAKFTLSGGSNLFNSNDIQFTAVDLDYRKYVHVKGDFSFAFRGAGGASFGRTPKLYFLGGTTNWIGNRTLDAKVYDVENLYFADVVTPLRGVPYYELSGDRYALINLEFRYPLIRYLAMGFPLPLVFSNVNGVLFTDIGSAWYGDKFKGGSSSGGTDRLQDIKMGFGFGWRLNLGIFLLRYDLAWGTDLHSVSDRPTHYFSFGADF